MADALPLKVRILLRNSYDPPTSHLQQSRTNLSSSLGIPVSLTIPWKPLIQTFSPPTGPDVEATATATSVLDLIIHTLVSIRDHLEDEEWGYAFLEKCAGGRLELSVLAGDKQTGLEWVDGVLRLGVANDVFSGEGARRVSACVRSLGEVEGGEEFEHVPPLAGCPIAPAAPTASSGILPPGGLPVGPERMPALQSLPPPSVLFSKPPYILYILITRASISVNGNHEPSLRLLSEYLSKWARPNTNDTRNPPFCKVELRESYLRDGVRDLLVLEPYDQRWACWMDMRPAVALAFVEGVLGYVRDGGEGGRVVVYRRERAFVRG
ncbi:MAG: hypothetical protein MMC23_000295 [Stictis urceolatum]|nr:hypothetical protein [Stictis urceolata]